MRFFWNIAVLGVVLGAALIWLPQSSIVNIDKNSAVAPVTLVPSPPKTRSIAASSAPHLNSPPVTPISQSVPEEIRQTFEGVEVFPPRLRSDWDASRVAHLRVEGRFRLPAEGVEWEKSRRVIFFDGDRMRRAHEIWNAGIQKIVDGETGEVLYQRDKRIY
jgi:hypothetical protein